MLKQMLPSLMVATATEGFLAFLALGFLDLDVVASELHVREGPIVHILRPFGTTLDTHVLEGGDKLVDQEVLQADLTS